MRAQDIMESHLVTATPGTRLPEAVRLMRDRGIRHLLVLEEGRLVGIVSDRDLKQAVASALRSVGGPEREDLLERLVVGDIMARTVMTIGPTDPVEDAARIMAREKISALPVTQGRRCVGIVTETDVLRLFVRALGALEPSSRLDVVLGADATALADVVQTLEAAGAPISSVMTLIDRTGVKTAVIRVATINPEPAIRALRARGYGIADPLPLRPSVPE
jgi:acetoin utilization protein AcuB